MTFAAVSGVSFDFDENTFGPLPAGAQVECVFWKQTDLPVKLCHVVVGAGPLIPSTLIGENFVEANDPTLLEFLPAQGDQIKIQLSLDGTNWIQVKPVDIFNRTTMLWAPGYFFAVKHLRRAIAGTP